ncbi:MAG: Rne/Rng family ribonuclease [Deltaproteobacteria bacterium]|nr:Rne/Rng family ribonuclease [Deltaproteobacteria bacterium]
MGSTLVVNSTAEQTRVALLDGSTVVELLIERRKERGLVGNIYKGRVQRVLPGMQAAFVEIGLERTAFLYAGDLIEEGAGETPAAASEPVPDAGDDDEDPTAVAGRPAANLIAAVKLAAEAPPVRRHPPRIEDRLKANQEVVVQVAKEPIGTKGARVTAHISLPGRHLVFMPTVDHIGISRRISDESERERLRAIVETLRPPGTGFVVRTAAEGVPQHKLEADMEFLITLWNDVQRAIQATRAPGLVHPDLDVVLRAARDLFTSDVDRLVVDDRDTFDRLVRFVGGFAPALVRSIELYEGTVPVFDAFAIEGELARALSRKVWLKSGGYIVWDEAEALTVVDVNTGRFVGKRDLEDTITRTNLEAAREIAYQLRLRNVGGVVVVDFIDMEETANRQRVLDALRDLLAKDRARVHVLGMSELGLVELTRQRVRESLLHVLTEPCPYCEGKGFVLSRRTVAYDVLRRLRQAAAETEEPAVQAECHPDVAALIYDEEPEAVEEIEGWSGKRVVVRGRDGLHVEQHAIRTLDGAIAPAREDGGEGEEGA